MTKVLYIKTNKKVCEGILNRIEEKKIKIHLIKPIKTNIIYKNNFLCRLEREMEMWRTIIGIRL